MPFVEVRCPTCSGEIQLDDTREYGFCMFCGGKVIYKEAVQQIIVTGSVNVERSVDHLIKSANGFLALEKWKKAYLQFKQATEEDSTDYRGWWGMFIASTMKMTGITVDDYYHVVVKHCCHYHFSADDPTPSDMIDWGEIDDESIQGIIENATNAIKFAPNDKKAELELKLSNYNKLLSESIMRCKAKKEEAEDRLKEELRQREEALKWTPRVWCGFLLTIAAIVMIIYWIMFVA